MDFAQRIPDFLPVLKHQRHIATPNNPNRNDDSDHFLFVCSLTT